jgi:Transcriptional regulators
MSDDVSLATVAARAGVSVSTVSRIVNGEMRRASQATVARVLDAIEAVGYRPNPVGRALKRGQSQLVAMIAANLDNPAMATIASSTRRRCARPATSWCCAIRMIAPSFRTNISTRCGRRW